MDILLNNGYVTHFWISMYSLLLVYIEGDQSEVPYSCRSKIDENFLTEKLYGAETADKFSTKNFTTLLTTITNAL